MPSLSRELKRVTQHTAKTQRGSGFAAYFHCCCQGFTTGKKRRDRVKEKNRGREEINKPNKAAETMPGVNRNLAQDGARDYCIPHLASAHAHARTDTKTDTWAHELLWFHGTFISSQAEVCVQTDWEFLFLCSCVFCATSLRLTERCLTSLATGATAYLLFDTSVIWLGHACKSTKAILKIRCHLLLFFQR